MGSIAIKNALRKCREHKHEEYYSGKDKDGYSEYIKKHGYHFTDSLAKYAICDMVNAVDGKHGHWTVGQVTEAIGAKQTMHRVTRGDLAYQANMYYADLYPKVIISETACLDGALAIANDPDGYEGQIFCRWVADVMAKRKEVEWKKFIEE